MKTKILFSLAAVALLLSAFTSCNPNQKKIVGHWKEESSSTNDYEEDNIEATTRFKGVMTYNSDGTFQERGTYETKFTFTDDELEGVTLNLSYKFNCAGDFEVKGEQLKENTTDVNISFASASTNLSYDLKDLERTLINSARNAYEENNCAELKKIAYEPREYTIVSITDHKLVLKDDEGEIEEYTR